LLLSSQAGARHCGEGKMGEYAPSAANRPLLGSLLDDFGNATLIPQSFHHQPRFLGTLPRSDGAALLAFDSALELDTDGFPGGVGDPDQQAETSLRYANRASLDANRVPFFVLPLPSNWPTKFGIALGDYAAVLFRGKLAFAVFGDQGPSNKLGEGSLQLLRELGEERLKPNGHIINAGTEPGVLTIVFPGSGAVQDRHDETTLLHAIHSKGRSLFQSAGGQLPA
jgi:Fungal chitosanase of glycosyl hydrolase group 75